MTQTRTSAPPGPAVSVRAPALVWPVGGELKSTASRWWIEIAPLRLRNARTVNYGRLLLAGVLFALIPVATEIAALATLAGVNAMPWTMIACETARYDERATGCATA